MVKLIAMYRVPDDAAAFDKHYDEIHTPLVLKWPGLRRLEVSRITGAPIGFPSLHLIAEMYFDDELSMQAALRSPEGKAAAKDVMAFAGHLVSMAFASVHEQSIF